MAGRPARRTGPVRIIAAVVSALVALIPAAPAGAAAPTGAAGPTTFSVSPAYPSPTDPLSRSYFRPVVSAGSSVVESVAVVDTGERPVQLLVYPVDGLTATTSGTVYADRSDPRTRAGTWVTAAQSSLTVLPHHQVLVSFRVDVPADATPGDHVAGIAFEDANPTTSAGLSITEVIRSAADWLMTGPITISGFIGSPIGIASTKATNLAMNSS